MDDATNLGSLIFRVGFDQYRSAAGIELRNLCGDCGDPIFLSLKRVEQWSEGGTQDFNRNRSIAYRNLLFSVAVRNEYTQHWGFAGIKLNIVEKPNNETLFKQGHRLGSR